MVQREAAAWGSERGALVRACVAPGTGGERSWVSRTHTSGPPASPPARYVSADSCLHAQR